MTASSQAPLRYVSHENLEIAAQVAVELRQPLLLTGEPGTGKTTYARHLAAALGPADAALPVLGFETKSTSMSKDLFYHYDSLRRFHAAHDADMSRDNRDYVTFNALGEAIIRSRPPAEVQDLAPNHREAGRSVVLIDEIDKAPRDFPNDILNEIERLFFRIPELKMRTIEADPAYRPVVVITSNSEKNLPDAFLRRCVFYHIPFPDRDQMVQILRANMQEDLAFLGSAVDFFYGLRELDLEKPPATAELVGWLRALMARGASAEAQLSDARQRVQGTLGILLKTREDMERARNYAGDRLGGLLHDAQY